MGGKKPQAPQGIMKKSHTRELSDVGCATALVGGYSGGLMPLIDPPSSVPCLCLCMVVNSTTGSVAGSAPPGQLIYTFLL